MKIESLKVLSYVGTALLFLTVGILLGAKFNDTSKKQDELVLKTERIATSTVIINGNNSENSISSNELSINKSLVNTYTEVINSKFIKDKIRKSYPNVNSIELDIVENTQMLKAVYVCEDYTDKECIDITNKYVSNFVDNIDDIYNVKASVVDSATSVTTRVVE